MPTQTLEAIPFRDTAIYALKINGIPHVAVKPVCQSIGVDANGQVQRLKRQPWASTCITHAQLPGDSQTRDVTFIDRRTFTMWLATIETSRVKDEGARDLLVSFQREAADVLDAYFSGKPVGQQPPADIPEAIEHQLRLLERAQGLLSPEALDAETLRVIHGEVPRTPVDVEEMPRPLPVPLEEGREWFTYREYIESKGVPANHSIIASLAVYTVRVFRRERGAAPGNLGGYRYIDPARGGYITGFTEDDLPLINEAWAKVCQKRGIAHG